ncbi:MAG: hydrogenase maturation nickel metallochaperone HypA [Chlorobi bacterium]|nr:hydrogenase maturation nickel metallochaperone HypA [Chlorobiota bacterium]
MHEFSIALSIIEIAEEEARKVNSDTISELVLDIGTMAGIEFHALDFAMESATRNTLLDGAKIVVNKIQANGRCKDCGHEFEIMTAFDQCPKCKGYFIETLNGKELKIKSLVAE